MEKLLEEADLQPNQALADYRIKTTHKCFLGIITRRTLTASATVVEFSDSQSGTFSDAKTAPDTNSNQSVRKAKLKRLIEINTALSNGSIENDETIATEIHYIEQWYNEKGFYKPIEWNKLNKAKEFIQKKDDITKLYL